MTTQIASALLGGVASLGLLATLYLFVSLKLEVRKSIRQQNRHLGEIAAKAQYALAQAEDHERRYQPAPVQLEGYLPRAGFNLHKRIHAMRLLRQGEDEAHIAAVLGVPRKEVELLIRVQQLGTRTIAAPRGDCL